jgi:hypothetical protein
VWVALSDERSGLSPAGVMSSIFLSFAETERERETTESWGGGVAVRDTRLGVGIEKTISSV